MGPGALSTARPRERAPSGPSMRGTAADPLVEALNGAGPPLEHIPPVLERHGDEFVFRWPDVTITLSGVREGSEGIHGECAVRRTDEEIHWARLNLASTPGREAVVKNLLAIDSAMPWRRMLETTCRTTTEAVRKGLPAILLQARPALAPRYLIDPILPLGETAVLFGDGGAGKSYMALVLALAAMTCSPLPGGFHVRNHAKALYLDWEAVPDELEERLYLLSRGLGCASDGLHYRSMSRALADEMPGIRAEVSRLGVTFVIVDSLGPACGAEPEGADAAGRTMNALRSPGGTPPVA